MSIQRRLDRKSFTIKEDLTGHTLVLDFVQTMLKADTHTGLSRWEPGLGELSTRDGQIVDWVEQGVYRIGGRTYRSSAPDAP